MDDRFARILWQRLRLSNGITKLVSNKKPLGFNVQGDWELSGVNKATRSNKYRQDEHFAPHKDAQYAPNGDERSLFSLVIYLNDNYKQGETKFYFPKVAPKFDTKGLTIAEEIEAYGGLEGGYECVAVKPKKGYAVLFTHNLLHAIRYNYPRLLELKSKATVNHQDEGNQLIDKLSIEIWLSIFKHLHEQDVQHLIFAFPKFQLLKIMWEAQETKRFETDSCRCKFIPTVHSQYGSRTLFRFPDSNFFYQHIDGCCRVAAVYAFFLLGHGPDSRTYTVRYDRNTHETCEVKMEKLLADAFYNRNCYGSIYRVVQKDEDYLSEAVKLHLSIINSKAVPNINDIVRLFSFDSSHTSYVWLYFQLSLRNVKSIDLSNNQIESLSGCILVLLK
ncbi:unnamed protein product [Rotaria sp. Silwood2]|nr:unnamed protein product [Rotaria sp. Silwood2]